MECSQFARSTRHKIAAREGEESDAENRHSNYVLVCIGIRSGRNVQCPECGSSWTLGECVGSRGACPDSTSRSACRSSGGQQNDPDGGAANSWREPCPHTPVERMRLVCRLGRRG